MKYVIEHTHIVDHEKFLEAGVHARDLWEWGMKYAGRHETAGHLSMAAVLASPWGYGGKANIKAANRLVEVGLWERTERGFLVLKWAEMGNKTKAQMEEKREGWRSKKRSQRSEKPSTPDPSPAGEPLECPRGTPQGTPERILNSYSPSSSGSGSDLGSREGVQGEPEPGVTTGVHVVRRAKSEATGAAPPDWAAAAVETVSASTGEKFDLAVVWVTYQGSREAEGRPLNRPDFQRFLGSWAARLKSDRVNARGRRADTRQPLGDPAQHEWLKRAASGENDL